MKNYVDKDKLQEYTTKLNAKMKSIFATKSEVGSPLVASTVAEMTDTNRIYVYTGSESGYTSGNWYYYDGSAWTSGGVYNSTAFETDATLAIPGKAADAKAVGDALENVEIEVDATLTQTGKAADAKAAGDAIGEIEGNVSDLKNAIKDLEDTQTIMLFSDTVSGTRSKSVSISLPSGTYHLHVDSVDSTAQSGTTSNLNFFNGNTNVKSIAVNRANGYDGDVTLSGAVTVMYFYGNNNYNDSAGIDFTFRNVILSQNTALNERLKEIENDIGTLESDVNAIDGEIDGINGVLSDMYEIRRNYFDKTEAIDGYYYSKASDSDDIVAVELNTMAGIIFPVERGKTYVVQRTDYKWYALDADKKVIANHGNNTGVYYLSITPNDTGVEYVAISWLKSYASIDTYMILDPGVSFGNYISYPYSIILKDNVMNASGIAYEKIYTVGAAGDFTSFTQMLAALQDDETPKTVYVETGTYDIFSEIGGQEFMESLTGEENWLDVCYPVPKNTKIVGIGNVVLLYHPTDANIVSYDRGWLISPLNIVASCEIENISIDASNCRYGIHIEESSGRWDAHRANVKLKNVRVHRAIGGTMGDHSAVGCGIGHNAKWYFEECRFSSDGQSAIFSVHTNSPSAGASAYIEFNNCIAESSHANAHSKSGFNFSSLYLGSAITNYVSISNCYTTGKVTTETPNTSTKRQSYDIAVIGGTSYGLTDSSDMTSGYTIKNYGNNIAT